MAWSTASGSIIKLKGLSELAVVLMAFPRFAPKTGVGSEL
jgi:hypothetical protein